VGALFPRTQHVARVAIAAALVASACALAGARTATATLPGQNGVIAYSVPDPEADLSYIEFVRPDGTRLDWPLANGFDIEGGSPAFSPAGRRLAYGGFGLIVTRVPPHRERRLPRSGCCWLDRNPSWSPTGGSLAFERFVARRRDRFVYITHSDGTHVRRLVRGQDPSWAVHGWIAFERDVQRQSQLYAIRPTGKRLRRITYGAGDKYSPDWSPDGRRIAFEQGGDIFTIRADGRRKRRLTRGPARDGTPAYSPDGTRIVFARGDRLIVIPSAGGRGHPIDCGYSDCYGPAWQPRPH
jgi:dipeptidyl aminopeptidase/acylaminoacyl peptidase